MWFYTSQSFTVRTIAGNWAHCSGDSGPTSEAFIITYRFWSVTRSKERGQFRRASVRGKERTQERKEEEKWGIRYRMWVWGLGRGGEQGQESKDQLSSRKWTPQRVLTRPSFLRFPPWGNLSSTVSIALLFWSSPLSSWRCLFPGLLYQWFLLLSANPPPHSCCWGEMKTCSFENQFPESLQDVNKCLFKVQGSYTCLCDPDSA